jgi:hypothetical protein
VAGAELGMGAGVDRARRPVDLARTQADGNACVGAQAQRLRHLEVSRLEERGDVLPGRRGDVPASDGLVVAERVAGVLEDGRGLRRIDARQQDRQLARGEVRDEVRGTSRAGEGLGCGGNRGTVPVDAGQHHAAGTTARIEHAQLLFERGLEGAHVGQSAERVLVGERLELCGVAPQLALGCLAIGDVLRSLAARARAPRSSPRGRSPPGTSWPRACRCHASGTSFRTSRWCVVRCRSGAGGRWLSWRRVRRMRAMVAGGSPIGPSHQTSRS